MSTNQRRLFIKTLGTGALGSFITPNILDLYHNSLSNHNLLKNSDDSEAYWEEVKAQFRFQQGLYYFNNASLGSSPLAVRNATKEYRDLLDDFPSKFMWGAWNEAKENVRKSVAELFSVSTEEIAIIHNTTEGMNLIARSFDLRAGDEIIIADHEHSSGTIPWEVWQETKGIKLVRPTLPLLPKSSAELLDVYKKAITPRTKIISMCHMVNTNGMILPVKEVSELAQSKGIKVAVDGAQSAGMFQINLKELHCDFYAASAHKWLFAPKGIGVLYVKKEGQKDLKPLIVARGHTDSSIRRLENYNTRNLPEYLGLGNSIAFLNSIGMEKIHSRSYALKDYFRSRAKTVKNLRFKTPESDSLSCAIQTVELEGIPVNTVRQTLIDNYNIDCRPMTSFGLNGVRLSFGIYITKKDIDYLIEALEEIANS